MEGNLLCENKLNIDKIRRVELSQPPIVARIFMKVCWIECQTYDIA
jgi:hypothetical protein